MKGSDKKQKRVMDATLDGQHVCRAGELTASSARDMRRIATVAQEGCRQDNDASSPRR